MEVEVNGHHTGVARKADLEETDLDDHSHHDSFHEVHKAIDETDIDGDVNHHTHYHAHHNGHKSDSEEEHHHDDDDKSDTSKPKKDDVDKQDKKEIRKKDEIDFIKGEDALLKVCQLLQHVDEDDDDVRFLQKFLDDPALHKLFEANDILEDENQIPQAKSSNVIDHVLDVLDELDTVVENRKVEELSKILKGDYFKSYCEAHDDIASKNYGEWELEEETAAVEFNRKVQDARDDDNTIVNNSESVKMIGIRKSTDEPLGITVSKRGNDLVVARILSDSFVDRQGLLHVGDIIKEVNGKEVSTPEQLMENIKRSNGSISLKVVPSNKSNKPVSQLFVKAHFTYDPAKDSLIPTREAGLAFKEGEILQVLNMEDNSWWQAKKVTEDGRAGLIPSLTLEERRKAFVRPDYDYTKKSLFCGLTTRKKKKTMYTSTKSSELDNLDLLIYEEVTRLPPFQRKTLVLIGAPGVGRRSLKNLLIENSPKTFGVAIPHTSRPKRESEKSGQQYYFEDKEIMARDINNDDYLEYGDFNGNYYGVKLSTIKDVIERDGKICLIDCNPQAIKYLKNGTFMPYVVFIAAPSVEILKNMYYHGIQMGVEPKTKTEREFVETVNESANMERSYRHFFDLIIVNDNLEETYCTLIEHMEQLISEPQWVPATWVY